MGWITGNIYKHVTYTLWNKKQDPFGHLHLENEQKSGTSYYRQRRFEGEDEREPAKVHKSESPGSSLDIAEALPPCTRARI